MSGQANRLCYYCRLPMRDGFQNWHQTNHAKLTYCVDALRAALDQERADNAKLRAFAQDIAQEFVDVALDTVVFLDEEDVAEVMQKYGLHDASGNPTALLSGREAKESPH